MQTIDLTPTWGEVGSIVKRLIVKAENPGLNNLSTEIAQAFAMAEVFKQLHPTLTDEQLNIASRVIVAELTKQGY